MRVILFIDKTHFVVFICIHLQHTCTQLTYLRHDRDTLIRKNLQCNVPDEILFYVFDSNADATVAQNWID